MCVLGVLSWVPDFRLVRAQIFSQREQEYVTAAKALGVREGHILRKHIIPNVMSVLLVSITLNFATCMLTESTLSYLGFGIPLPTPTWGNMLNSCNNSIVIQQYWWRWVFSLWPVHHLYQPDGRWPAGCHGPQEQWTLRRKRQWHYLKRKISTPILRPAAAL